MIPSQTHMPFVFPYNGNLYMLFGGKAGKSSWRLFQSLLAPWDPRPILTGSNPLSVECAPAAFVENGMIRLSVVINYRLHQFEGGSLDGMSLVKADTENHMSAVVTPMNICRADFKTVDVRDRFDNPVMQIDMGRFGYAPFVKLLRLSFVPEDPDKLIITGASLPTGPRSTLYSLSQDKAWLIQVAGRDVYKCALTHDTLYYVNGLMDDERVIVGSREYDLIPL